MELQGIWEGTLEGLSLALGSEVVDAWFSRVEPLQQDREEVILGVPTPYFQQWIEANYSDVLSSELSRRLGRPVGIRYLVGSQPPTPPPAPTRPAPKKEAGEPSNLNISQTFDSFVVGPSNEFAYASCLNVVRSPGSNYNPLFLFGGVGLGKTHLLNGIGNQLRTDDPSCRIIYLSAEGFMNQMIDSLRVERMENFRARFRERCDVLLIDDIQFLSGKGRTQEEFFHTFNVLHGSGRQIVMTSDKFPHEIEGMEERLRTRFAMGLVADIQPPELEMRMAILKTKAEEESFDLPQDVAYFLAESAGPNIRDLEGTLTRLIAYSSFYQMAVTIEFARRVLKDVLDTKETVVTIEGIQEGVARFFNLRALDLKLARRTKVLSLPRQIAMFLCRNHTRHSLKDIGRAFGGRDHSTVHHGIRKIEKELVKSPQLATQVEAIRRNLGLS